MTDEPGIGVRIAGFLRHDLFHAGARSGVSPAAGDRILTWANGITLLRFLALPVFIYLIIDRRAWGGALLLLWALAAMDVLDGYLARRLNQVSKIGTWIDPITDRAAMVCLAVSLVAVDLMPWWVAVLILFRELVLALVVGVACHGRMPIPVTRTGKIATLSLLIGVPGYLLKELDFGLAPIARAATLALTTVGVVLYYVSLFQYARAAAISRFGRPRQPTEHG